MFTNLGYVSTKALRVALVVALGATLATLTAVALVATSGTAVGQQGKAPTQPLYEVHDLGTLAGGPFSYAFGINQAGKVVGSSIFNVTPESVEEHPFLYSNGVMSDLGTLGGPYADAQDINDAGKVVGSSTTNAEGIERHAFLYSGGQMQDLDTLQGHSESFAMAINNKGEVVGRSWMSDENGPSGERAFLYSNGVMQNLGTLGGTFSSASGINEAGKVVGAAATSNREVHAFLYSGGQMQDLGTLGGARSAAVDINEAGKVVGVSHTSGNAERHTFLYSGGPMQDLGTLAEPYNSYSYPTALNKKGEVVGQSGTTDGDFEHPFLYSDGVMRDLNSLISADSGWELVSVEDINDNGHIVGKAQHKEDGREHAFLLTPVQESAP